MTKAEVVTKIAKKTSIEESIIFPIVESFMTTVKDALAQKENVYLKGFGSFVVKHRKQTTGRNILKQQNVIIPAHDFPAFKPSDTLKNKVKQIGYPQLTPNFQ